MISGGMVPPESFDMTATLGYSRLGDSEAHEFDRISKNGRHSFDGPARRATRGRLQRPAERTRGGAGRGDSAGGSRRIRPNTATRANDEHDAGAAWARRCGRTCGCSQHHRAIQAVRNGSAVRNGNPDVDANTCSD